FDEPAKNAYCEVLAPVLDVKSKLMVDLDPIQVRRLFAAIPDEDVCLLNMDVLVTRPESLILDVLPVPPVPLRPGVEASFSGSTEDDLTIKTSEILIVSESIRQGLDRGERIQVRGYIEGCINHSQS
ncbi:hypothetical protein KIPB_016474, partial [Kipferlia bialata]